MAKRLKKKYYVVEQKKGGKRWRRMGGSTGTKEEATRYKTGVKRVCGGRFNYRLRWELA